MVCLSSARQTRSRQLSVSSRSLENIPDSSMKALSRIDRHRAQLTTNSDYKFGSVRLFRVRPTVQSIYRSECCTAGHTTRNPRLSWELLGLLDRVSAWGPPVHLEPCRPPLVGNFRLMPPSCLFRL
jgi:hypothetical protein